MIKRVLLIFALAGSPILADTINADDATQSAVQTAVNSSSTGDTVVVPAGNETWASQVSISGKSITVQGNGIGNTVITRTSGQAFLVDAGTSSRITGFEFLGAGLGVLARGVGWRIDNCKFEHSSWSTGVRSSAPSLSSPHADGLVDNCTFVGKRVVALGNASLLAHNYWFDDLNLGTSEAVYVEDCTFTGISNTTNAIDGNYGGKYVFRHNTVVDMYLEGHSVQGNNRALRKFEIYNNTITQSSRTVFWLMFLRGGTGVVFNNTVTGTFGKPKVAFDVVRAYNSYSFPPGDAGSLWDGDQPEADDWLRDQIGRGKDETLWEDGNLYPPQTLDPAYVWDNTINAVPLEVEVVNPPSEDWIIEDRDFVQGSAKPGYSSYTYPHPLQGTVDPPTLISAIIGATGTTLTLTFSEPVVIGTGGNGGVALTMTGGATTAAYSTGSGSQFLAYNLSRSISNGETGTTDYTQPGDGIEANDDGADVATYSSVVVINSVPSPTTLTTPTLTVGP